MREETASRSMQIGEIAERSGLSLRTLRHYDEIGLLRPSARSEGGFRLYTQADLDRLMVIRRMKPLGFPLEAMHEVMVLLEQLHGSAPDPDVRARLRTVVVEARQRREGLERQLAMADEFIELLGRELA